MKYLIFILMCLCFVVAPVAAQDGAGGETIKGTYAIYKEDKPLETDEYEVVLGELYVDEIRASSSTHADKRYETKYVDGKFQSYEQLVNGLSENVVKVDGHMVSFYEKTSMVGAMPVENDVVLFDQSAYTSFYHLLNLFDQKKGSKQTQSVLVPSLQDFIEVEIERHGSDAVKMTEKTLTAAHYRVIIGKKKDVANLWMDGSRIVAMYLATTNRFIVDNSYAGLYDRIKQIVNRAL